MAIPFAWTADAPNAIIPLPMRIIKKLCEKAIKRDANDNI
jgi:hypothetical protein